MKNSSGKSSIPRYLNLLRDLNKRFPSCSIQSKSKESHMLTGINNLKKTDISEIYEHCTPLSIPYLITPLVVSDLNYFHNPGIKIT